MADISDLQSRLESLKQAYHSGVMTVRHGETTTVYRSLNEMKNIILNIESEINILSGNGKPRRIRYALQTTKGL